MAKKTETLSKYRDIKEWYSELNEREKKEFRDKVIAECEISDTSFYDYIGGAIPKKPIREKLALLTGLSETEM